MNLLSMSKQQILMMLIARVIIILLVLPLHEFAHAWVARLCGDDTADSKGRLTLNPFSHVDSVSDFREHSNFLRGDVQHPLDYLQYSLFLYPREHRAGSL